MLDCIYRLPAFETPWETGPTNPRRDDRMSKEMIARIIQARMRRADAAHRAFCADIKHGADTCVDRRGIHSHEYHVNILATLAADNMSLTGIVAFNAPNSMSHRAYR